MNNIATLYKFRLRGFLNQTIQQLDNNKLKIIIIFSSAIILWFCIFIFFHRSFIFVDAFEEVGAIVKIYFLALFFFALGIMLVVSNAIINYSSLFQSLETAYLFSLPFSPVKIFFYKITESLLFSSWAFLFLGSPLLIAYGINAHSRWLYYFWMAIFSAVFIILPALLGGFISLMLGRFLPRRRREVILLTLLLIVLVIIIAISQMQELTRFKFTAGWMQVFLHKLSFAQNIFLPSYWVTRGLISATGDGSETLFFFFLFLSQILFLGLIMFYLSGTTYFTAYSLVHSSRKDKKYPAISYIDRLGNLVMQFLRRPIRLIILKDVKTIIRDPVQWSQFLIFFGLLAIYFINIRNIPYIRLNEILWQYLVSSLNVVATTLTLATFTTRFVYPQISLEGKRFWIIGMMPISREDIFYSKFIFAFLGSILIAEPLIFISSYQLEIPLSLFTRQLYQVFLISLGLSALAVSLGVLYPEFKEDNPSKIVSGFGGTLTLVTSLLYTLTIIVIDNLPSHLFYVLGKISAERFSQLQTICTIITFLIAIGVSVFSLSLGLRAIRKIEV
ncbi:MAG: hypothetical protein QME51_01060 [Planctomycetota bacterium]|nr:hypothetical protein [Planctomycetota bacterium]MDI6786946.1 hypothetical protein [Planctomycetota bacterium]